MARNPSAFKAMRSRQVQRFVAHMKLNNPDNELLKMVTGDDLKEAENMAKLSKADDDDDEECWPENWLKGDRSFKVFFYRYFRQWATAQRDRDEYDGPSKHTRSQTAKKRGDA